MIAWLALIGCGGVQDDWVEPEVPPVVAGAPMVGAAEGFLKLPVGTPLSGFTARCECFFGVGRQDARESAYVEGFIPSTGVHTHPAIKVIWIDNGDDHLVITKTDSIYSSDQVVEALEEQLSASTGIDLRGKVVHTANHSHNSYGDFTDALTFYLGSDQFNREIFERFVGQVHDVAKTAFDQRQPGKIGMSIHRDWDPDNQVYSDRRGINNDVVIGEPPLPTGKDPHATILRLDTLEDDPIAVMVNFGMHGIVLDVDNGLVSSDSGGGVEAYLNEAFDEPVVVMFTQGSGGDQSPRGEQDDYARIESIGARATPLLIDLIDQTPTSDAPFTLQSASRAIQTHPSVIQVTRNGTVDWRYQPFDGQSVDNEVYGPDGSLLSPIDEFTTDHGALFCGTGDIVLPGSPLPGGVDVPPYDGCVRIEALMPLLTGYFDIDPSLYGLAADDEYGVPLPTPDSLRANTLASVADGLLVRDADGNEAPGQVLFGFFPGEATHMYNETFRRRAAAELGVDHAVMVSYAMDHEGYLLIPEDWLLGEYEADISLWGPLASEYVMEELFGYTAELLQDDVHQHPDPLGMYARTRYPEKPLPTVKPDVTPEAGTVVSTVPDTFWVPGGFEVQLGMPAQVPRVSGQVQLAWLGGDPGVDEPIVTLEREVNGTFETVTTPTGRPINDSQHDILKGYTPDPLEPLDALQDHYWWIVWQAVDHTADRAGLPLGTYRFRVEGQSYGGTAATWPWDAVPYSFTSDSFEVVAGTVAIQADANGLLVSLDAPASGYRYIEAGGNHRGPNPVPGAIEVSWATPGGPVTETVTGTREGNRTRLGVTAPVDATAVTVTDAYGNVGTLAL